MPEASKAESLLHALAGRRLVLFAALFLEAAPLRYRAWACVLVLLFRIVSWWCLSLGLAAMPPAERSG